MVTVVKNIHYIWYKSNINELEKPKKMIQDLITALNDSKGATFVAFEYTNRFGEVAGRLIQINASYESALRKDIDTVPNVEYVENELYDKATFILAQSEILKSLNLSLGNEENANKTEVDQFNNRSNGQKDAYIPIAKNVKYNVENQTLMLFAKEIRKNVITEGVYPTVNSRAKTLAKVFIKKTMKSTKFRSYKIEEISSIKVNGDTIELG